ncbi:MAG: hypothetical protein VW452_04925 [Pelagibacteraceae bacterium]
MKLIAIIIFLLPGFVWADILEKFSLACICDRQINALKYFDCKQKVPGTQLDLLDRENMQDIKIISSFDEKEYQLTSSSEDQIEFIYETEDYESKILINAELDMDFSILYKEYNKQWAYDLKCVSLKKE